MPHAFLSVLLPLAFLAAIFLLMSCVGCSDQVLGALRRLVHRREQPRGRQTPPSAPAT
jgi:hypothetical protein